MNKSDEDKLIQSVSFAAGLVQQGEEPNSALLKTAEEHSLQPGELRVVCNAFNTGRQNVQWGQRGDILDKLASTPLADYSTVFRFLWGEREQVKAATVSTQRPELLTYSQQRHELTVTGDYFPEIKPPAAEKAANAHDERAAKFRNLHELRQRVGRQRTEKVAAESQFNLQLHQLYTYFRKSAALRASFDSVKSAAVAYRGDHCEALFDHIQDRIPARLLAGGSEKFAVNWAAEPFCYVDRLIAAAQKVATEQDKYDKIAADYGRLFNDAHEIPTEQPPTAAVSLDPLLDLPPSPAQKQGGVLTGMASAGAFGATKSLVDALAEDDRDKLQKYVTELDSPQHSDSLRKIRSQTLLAELLSDPDNPISAYDPDQVADAYNDLVRLAPRVADQPSVVSALLQKRLLGNVEPFELGETLKLESGLKQTQAPAAAAAIELKGNNPWT